MLVTKKLNSQSFFLISNRKYEKKFSSIVRKNFGWMLRILMLIIHSEKNHKIVTNQLKHKKISSCVATNTVRKVLMIIFEITCQ